MAISAARALRVGLVGPLPPPAGGMATQCEQLRRLLLADGFDVSLVRTNEPYRPQWIGHVRVARAIVRLTSYAVDLWRMAREVDVVHVLANSGWAWHLFAAPAVWIARLRKVPVVVNYRGGEAEAFLRTAPAWVRQTLLAADARVTPSDFLRVVLARHGIDAQVIPNVVDLSLFRPRSVERPSGRVHIVVTRNLEPIYDIGTAIRAFALIVKRIASAELTITGEGPEGSRLGALAVELGIADRARFSGRLGRDSMAALYQGADLMLNPSTVDNMPNSILEAYASGVPVVSTNVGGIPSMARNFETALLVPPRDPQAMADAACKVLSESALACRLVQQGLVEVQRYTWNEVRCRWIDLYMTLAGRHTAMVAQRP